MSQVTVYTDLVLRSGPFAADLQAIEQQILATARRISAAGINVPVKLDDQATGKIEELLAKMRGQPIDLKLTATDDVTAQLDRIRATEAGKPVHVPVVLDAPIGGAAPLAGPAGAVGAAGVAAAGAELPLEPPSMQAIQAAAAAEARAAQAAQSVGAAGVAAGGAEEAAAVGAGAGGAGFFAGTLTRRGLGAAYIAYHGLNTLATEIGKGVEGEELDRFTDPNEQLDRRRRLIESEHQGLRGGVNWLYGKAGLEPTYDEEMKTLDEAQRDAQRADEKIKKRQQGAQAQDRLKEQVESLDTAAAEVGQNETESRLMKLDAAFKKINDAADNIVEHFDKFGFKTEAEAKAVADRMKSDAGTIRTAGQQDVYNDNNRAGLTHQAAIDAINEARREADLRAQGQTEQAALAARHANVDRQLGAFERRAVTAPEGSEEKRRATEEFEAAKPAAAAEHEAIDVAERERVADSVNRYEIEAERAKLSAVRGSYNEELRAFEKMWDAKLAKIQNSQEKAAAIQARDAERTAMASRHTEDIADIKASTHEIELRTAGKDKEADVFRVTDEARKALDEAGDDLERKGAILAHERAQLEALRHEDRGAIFGSVTSFARDVSVRNMRNTGGADIQAAIDTANAEQAAVDAARRQRPPQAPVPPAAPAPPPVAANPAQTPVTVTAPLNPLSIPIASVPLGPGTTTAPIAPPDEYPTTHDDMERQPGETIDAWRKRQTRAKYGHDGAFRPTPHSRPVHGWVHDDRQEKDYERQRHAVTGAASDAAIFTNAVMPGGGFFESLQPDYTNAGIDAANFADTNMPGGGWFESMQPGEMPSAADISNPTMDAIKMAMGTGGQGRTGGLIDANAGASVFGGDDPQAKRDFKDGSSDLKDAAASLNRTLSDEKNRLYVVR